MNVKRKMEGILYKVGVGSFMYAMVATRADIVFAVSTVSQFMSKASSPHWMAVKRIMIYLKGTLEFKLCLGGKDIVLRGFCDADWVGDANDWQSNMDMYFLLALESFRGNARNNQPLHRLRQKQNTRRLAVVLRKRFGFGNFWWMWDMCKQDRHP